jgi:hypothetical protein
VLGGLTGVTRVGNQAIVPSNTGWPVLQPPPIYVNSDDDQSKFRCRLEDPTDGCMTGSRRERSAHNCDIYIAGAISVHPAAR